ncbi:hypothetical protein D3C84_787760 [compost metagenome]
MRNTARRIRIEPGLNTGYSRSDLGIETNHLSRSCNDRTHSRPAFTGTLRDLVDIPTRTTTRMLNLRTVLAGHQQCTSTLSSRSLPSHTASDLLSAVHLTHVRQSRTGYPDVSTVAVCRGVTHGNVAQLSAVVLTCCTLLSFHPVYVEDLTLIASVDTVKIQRYRSRKSFQLITNPRTVGDGPHTHRRHHGGCSGLDSLL